MGDSVKRSFLYETIESTIFEREPKENNTILHFISSNNGKTFDGVANGGKRVANEVIDVITRELNIANTSIDRDGMKESMIDHVTISILGVSLGGLYGRYAIHELYQTLYDPIKSKMTVMNGTVEIFFNTFFTIVSPHLGESELTYVPVTRKVETWIANATKQSGQDAFHMNALFWDMATSTAFLKPLGMFRKRIALTNSFHTDLMVSASNGAFLHSYSQYPHSLMDNNEKLVECSEGLAIASVLTKKQPLTSPKIHKNLYKKDLLYMSVCLDSLGWKKIFLDTRSINPTTVSFAFIKRKTRYDIARDVYKDLKSVSKRNSNGECILTSRELKQVFGSQKFPYISLFPVGHPLVVGLSRSLISAALTWQGRSLSKFEASEFVEEVFSFHSTHNGDISVI